MSFFSFAITQLVLDSSFRFCVPLIVRSIALTPFARAVEHSGSPSGETTKGSLASVWTVSGNCYWTVVMFRVPSTLSAT